MDPQWPKFRQVAIATTFLVIGPRGVKGGRRRGKRGEGGRGEKGGE